MNRIVVRVAASAAALALLVATAVNCGGGAGPVDGGKVYAHAEKIVGFGPRPAGSAALGRTADYLVEQIRALGLEPQEQRWEQTVQAYDKPTVLALRNVWTQVPGKDPDHGPILAIAAHYDSKLCQGHPEPSLENCRPATVPCAAHNFDFIAALDSAGSCGVLLELARALQQRTDLVPNVWLIWFDGEESAEFHWKDDTALLGSRHFVKAMSADKTRFPRGLGARLRTLVLLDLLGDPTIKLDRDIASNSDLLAIFQDAAESLGTADRLYEYESPMTDDHIPFKNAGIAVIDLIDFRFRVPGEFARPNEAPPPEGKYTAWWHTPADSLDNLSADSLGWVGNLIWHALPGIESTFYGK